LAIVQELSVARDPVVKRVKFQTETPPDADIDKNLAKLARKLAKLTRLKAGVSITPAFCPAPPVRRSPRRLSQTPAGSNSRRCSRRAFHPRRLPYRPMPKSVTIPEGTKFGEADAVTHHKAKGGHHAPVQRLDDNACDCPGRCQRGLFPVHHSDNRNWSGQ
jgi:hypothetical protein